MPDWQHYFLLKGGDNLILWANFDRNAKNGIDTHGFVLCVFSYVTEHCGKQA